MTTAQDTTTQSFRPEVSVAQLKTALDSDEEFFLLDVRTQAEYDDAHVGGTDAQIPFTEIIARQSELPADKETLVYCICRSGRRSGIATAAMTKLGYTKVYNVVGGLLAWATADYPIER